MYKKFHSQFGEDKHIRETFYSDYSEDGVFVDIGAGHPTKLSNSYHFERNGWDGICIDADSRRIKELMDKRDCEVIDAVITKDRREVFFYQHPEQPDISRINVKDNGIGHKRKSIRIEDILEDFGIKKIDLLSIDVEGFELEALESFELEKHKPEVIIVEFLTLKNDRSFEIEKWFNTNAKNYFQFDKTTANLIYKRNNKK